MGAFIDTAKNTMLDALTVTYLSLHTDDPSTTGANEVTGGDYTREAGTINAAASGSRALNADVTFDVPACTVKYVGYWTAIDGTFIGSDAVTNETFTAAGQYKVLAAGTTLSI